MVQWMGFISPCTKVRGQELGVAVDDHLDAFANWDWTGDQELQFREVVDWICQFHGIIPSVPGKLPFIVCNLKGCLEFRLCLLQYMICCGLIFQKVFPER